MSAQRRSGYVVGRLREMPVIVGLIIVVVVMALRNVRPSAEVIAGIAPALQVVARSVNKALCLMVNALDQSRLVSRYEACAPNVRLLFGELAQ